MVVPDVRSPDLRSRPDDQRGSSDVTVRPARPADVGTLLQMKREFAIQEQTEFALRATADDWLRDGFGPQPRFEAGLAEHDGAVAGMITFSERYYTGWAGSSLYIQDLYVDPAHRGRGVAGALLAWLASIAVERASPFVELTVRTDNPAQELYRGAGFQAVESCATLVLAGPALTRLGGTGGTGIDAAEAT